MSDTHNKCLIFALVSAVNFYEVLEPLRSSLKSVLSLSFTEEPDYDFYIRALKKGFKQSL